MKEIEKEMIVDVIKTSDLVDPDISFYPDYHKVMILVLSESFKDMDGAARQQKIWNILHNLPDEVVVKVSFAFTSTQEEEDAQEEADDADEGEGASNPELDTQGA